MTIKARAALQQKIVRLEISAVMTERFYQELQAEAPSARTVRHLRTNRKLAASLASELDASRKKLGARPTGAVPPDSPVHASR